jgi:hypothetical protein
LSLGPHAHSPAAPYLIVAAIALPGGLYSRRARGLRHLGEADFRTRREMPAESAVGSEAAGTDLPPRSWAGGCWLPSDQASVWPGAAREQMIFSMSAEEWDLVMRVVNTSSEAFLPGSPGQPSYAAARAGIVAPEGGAAG